MTTRRVDQRWRTTAGIDSWPPFEIVVVLMRATVSAQYGPVKDAWPRPTPCDVLWRIERTLRRMPNLIDTAAR
jgi:hypothetical protein